MRVISGLEDFKNLFSKKNAKLLTKKPEVSSFSCVGIHELGREKKVTK